MIPEQLREYPLIRLCGPTNDGDSCSILSHSPCDSPGKRPLKEDWQNKNKRLSSIKRHLRNSGNYGIVARENNDLVIIDSDSDSFKEIVDDSLPLTYRVESGNGRHSYYRCSDWSENTRWESDSLKGEIKAVNSQVVGPGSTHPNGSTYSAPTDREIVEISPEDLSQFVENVEGVERGAAGQRARHPPSPHSTPESLDFIQREDIRQKIAKILRQNNPAHNDRQWLAGWLHGAAGLRENEIVDIIVSEASWGDLDRSVVSEQVASVIKSSRSSRATHYSEYSPDDSGNWGSPGEGKPRNWRSMPSDTKRTANAKNGSIVARAALREIDPDSMDDSWETVSLVFGNIEQDDDFGEVPTWETNQYNDVNFSDIGGRSPDELRLAASALESLADDLED
jgi:hypothetical protein